MAYTSVWRNKSPQSGSGVDFVAYSTASQTVAIPCPTPMHMVASP